MAEKKTKMTSEKVNDARSERVQAAVEAAWMKEQPKELVDVTWGVDVYAHGYRCWVAPVVRDVAAALGLEATPAGFGEVLEELNHWTPDHGSWDRVKGLLIVCCNECSNSMGQAGAEKLDNDFLLKAPDLMMTRAKAAQKGGGRPV